VSSAETVTPSKTSIKTKSTTVTSTSQTTTVTTTTTVTPTTTEVDTTVYGSTTTDYVPTTTTTTSVIATATESCSAYGYLKVTSGAAAYQGQYVVASDYYGVALGTTGTFFCLDSSSNELFSEGLVWVSQYGTYANTYTIPPAEYDSYVNVAFVCSSNSGSLACTADGQQTFQSCSSGSSIVFGNGVNSAADCVAYGLSFVSS
jgi:hypothetical protein